MPEDKYAHYSMMLRTAIDGLAGECDQSQDDIESIVEQALDDNFNDGFDYVPGPPKPKKS